MFKDMTDPQLWDAYWDLRRAIARAGDLACSTTTRHGRQVAARGVGRNLDHLDIVVAIARQRGLNLLGARPS